LSESWKNSIPVTSNPSLDPGGLDRVRISTLLRVIIVLKDGRGFRPQLQPTVQELLQRNSDVPIRPHIPLFDPTRSARLVQLKLSSSAGT
jgi:hypothetical protein